MSSPSGPVIATATVLLIFSASFTTTSIIFVASIELTLPIVYIVITFFDSHLINHQSKLRLFFILPLKMRLPERNYPLLLIIVWLLVHIVLLSHYGIRQLFDSIDYINEA